MTAPPHKAFRAAGTQRSRAVGADSVGTSPPQTAPERQCQASPSTSYCYSRSGPSRPRSVRPSANRTLSVFVGVWEPKVSQPLRRQSLPTPSHQTASPASLRFAPAPWSLPDSQPPHKATTPIPRLRDWTATKANWGAQAPTTVRNRPSYHARRTAKGYKYISRSQRLPPLRLRILWGCILL